MLQDCYTMKGAQKRKIDFLCLVAVAYEHVMCRVVVQIRQTWSLAKRLLDYQEKRGFFFLESGHFLMMVLTWTTLSDVSRDGSMSSSDDIFIVYLSFLSLFLLPRC